MSDMLTELANISTYFYTLLTGAAAVDEPQLATVEKPTDKNQLFLLQQTNFWLWVLFWQVWSAHIQTGLFLLCDFNTQTKQKNVHRGKLNLVIRFVIITRDKPHTNLSTSCFHSPKLEFFICSSFVVCQLKRGQRRRDSTMSIVLRCFTVGIHFY